MQTVNRLNAGRIYVIQAVGFNRYKIGFTTRSVEERLKELQPTKQCTPYKKVIETEIKDNAYQLEQLIHQYFKEYRVNGEWFDLDPANLNLLNLMLDWQLHTYIDKLQEFADKNPYLYVRERANLLIGRTSGDTFKVLAQALNENVYLPLMTSVIIEFSKKDFFKPAEILDVVQMLMRDDSLTEKEFGKRIAEFVTRLIEKFDTQSYTLLK